jgi:hypothetical protein
VDSSCLAMTLKSGLDKRRSNSLNTRGCGESRQMDSFAGLERLVATAVRVVKTGRTGKGLWGRCSRIVTDELGVFHRTGSGNAVPGSRESSSRARLGKWSFVGGDRRIDVIRFLRESRVK